MSNSIKSHDLSDQVTVSWNNFEINQILKIWFFDKKCYEWLEFPCYLNLISYIFWSSIFYWISSSKSVNKSCNAAFWRTITLRLFFNMQTQRYKTSHKNFTFSMNPIAFLYLQNKGFYVWDFNTGFTKNVHIVKILIFYSFF